MNNSTNKYVRNTSANPAISIKYQGWNLTSFPIYQKLFATLKKSIATMYMVYRIAITNVIHQHTDKHQPTQTAEATIAADLCTK